MKNTQKFLDLLDNEELIDKICDMYVQLDKERFSGNNLSGWGYTIILSIDGNLDYMYNIKTSTRADVLEGTAVEIAYLDGNVELSWDALSDIYEVDNLDKFKEWIALEYDIDMDDEDAEDQVDNYINWSTYYDFDSEALAAIEQKVWEQGCDVCSGDEALDKIYNTVEKLRGSLENYVEEN